MDAPNSPSPPDPLPPAAPPPSAQPPEPPATSPSPFALDRSDVIALIALVISLLGTVLAYRETRILNEQQQLAMEQKAASVWPYVEVEKTFDYTTDSTLEFRFAIQNPGVGPALISKMDLVYEGQRVRADSLALLINHNHPEANAKQLSSRTFSEGIFSAGTTLPLAVIGFAVRGQTFEEMAGHVSDLALDCCYCSVYGTCWRYSEEDWALPSTECSVPLSY